MCLTRSVTVLALMSCIIALHSRLLRLGRASASVSASQYRICLDICVLYPLIHALGDVKEAADLLLSEEPSDSPLRARRHTVSAHSHTNSSASSQSHQSQQSQGEHHRATSSNNSGAAATGKTDTCVYITHIPLVTYCCHVTLQAACHMHARILALAVLHLYFTVRVILSSMSSIDPLF